MINLHIIYGCFHATSLHQNSVGVTDDLFTDRTQQQQQQKPLFFDIKYLQPLPQDNLPLKASKQYE